MDSDVGRIFKIREPSPLSPGSSTWTRPFTESSRTVVLSIWRSIFLFYADHLEGRCIAAGVGASTLPRLLPQSDSNVHRATALQYYPLIQAVCF